MVNIVKNVFKSVRMIRGSFSFAPAFGSLSLLNFHIDYYVNYLLRYPHAWYPHNRCVSKHSRDIDFILRSWWQIDKLIYDVGCYWNTRNSGQIQNPTVILALSNTSVRHVGMCLSNLQLVAHCFYLTQFKCGTLGMRCYSLKEVTWIKQSNGDYDKSY